MNIQIFEDVENESILTFLKNKGNCVACLNEPLGGTIVRLMKRKSKQIESINWCVFPNAENFELLTVNSDQDVKSIDIIQYDRLDNLLDEMCLFALVTNLIKNKETLVNVPKGAFVLVFDDETSDIETISKWRRLQEKRLLFTCKQSKWTRLIFPVNGVYKWQGV
tara:strand:- start:232 stop:726 length:495 start_codon:yes stop_codon:yes gene_type:complete